MRNNTIGTSFNEFLAEEGISEEVEAGAVKKLIVYQLQAVIEQKHISKTTLAVQLETSRANVGVPPTPLHSFR